MLYFQNYGFTKTQISLEQRRSNTDGKLYVKFYKDDVKIGTFENKNHQGPNKYWQ